MSFPSELISRSARLQVVAFRIIETGTYNTQFSRPFMTDMNEETMNKVIAGANQAMETGKQITPTLLAQVNDGKPIVTPTTQVEGAVEIPQGWSERRFRFLLTLDVHYAVGSVNRFHYTGYSSHMDYSHGHNLDPSMTFFINSVLRTATTKMMTPTQGLVQTERAVTSRHMIADANWQGAFQPQQKFMMRPEDVYMQMTTQEFMTGNDIIVDTRNMSQTNAAMSNLTNGLTHNFAASIMNAYAKASRVAPTYGNDDQCLTDAMRLLQVNNTNDDNPLVAAVANVRGSGIMQNNFTINDLMSIDPNAYNMIEFTPLTAEDSHYIHQAGQSNPWTGADAHTMAAVKISQALPALMAVTMIQNVRLVSTNHTPDGQPRTTITGLGFNQANLPQRNQTLADRFENEIVRDISFNNRLGYYLEISADSIGETRIKISLDGYPVEEFVTPSFADNLLTPIITTQQNNFVRIASDFNALLNELSPTGVNKYNPSIDPVHL